MPLAAAGDAFELGAHRQRHRHELLRRIGFGDGQAEEADERRTRQQFLQLRRRQCLAHGVTTILPNTSRSSITRSASAASGKRIGAFHQRVQSALPHHLQQRHDVAALPAVRAADLQLERPDEADVLLRIVTRGRAAGQQPAADLQAAHRLHPGVAAGEVHHHIETVADIRTAPRRLAVQRIDLLHEVAFGVVDQMIGAERTAADPASPLCWRRPRPPRRPAWRAARSTRRRRRWRPGSSPCRPRAHCPWTPACDAPCRRRPAAPPHRRS